MNLDFGRWSRSLQKARTLIGNSTLAVTWRSDRGSSLVEVSLLMPLFLLMLIGAAEMGRVAYYAIEVNSAARAAAEYAAENHATSVNTTNIALAATTDAANVGAVTTQVTTSCICSSGTTITCANAGTLCVSPARIEEFVQVSTSATINPVFNYPGLPVSYALSGQATMRVEQ
jgi:Flp pilus assembly protein TadG